MEKNSVPKGLIQDLLKDRKDHPTAEMIFADLKKIHPQIGLATVYRNLDRMVKSGKLSQINAPDGKRYDPDLSVHFHFKCNQCGNVEDFDFEEGQPMLEKASAATDRVLTGFYGEFRGLCKTCKANEK